uniref:GPI mannosyltransferase 2 n=1 Tax=Dermatophagoides pteronyssinus TaxID=6956 RepID=A0A6P6XPQ3_DERPT|nr:GPI mannosyltransferase 2-like [Dermatophagoides pteronyssinus]
MVSNSWPIIIIRKCLQSRIQLTLIAIVADQLIVDHHADAYHNETISKHFSSKHGWIEQIILRLMKPFISWDGQYFLTIAMNGHYIDEQMLAFFPLYPLLIRNFATILSLITLPIIQFHWITLIIISAYLINLICFCLSSCLLYELSRHFFINHDDNDNIHNDIMNIVELFIYNPASIFFTACYTESLFTSLTLAALYCLYIGQNSLLASLLFAFSTLTRSNGILSIGYIIFYQICLIWIEFEYKNRKFQQNISTKIFVILKNLFKTFVLMIIIIVPFLLYQYYAYKLFCNNDLITEKISPNWCYNSTFIIPLSYQAIQAKYWNIGFLRYYQWKQLPNFLIAIPILTIILYSSYEYFYTNFQFIQSIFRIDKYHQNIDIMKTKSCLPFVIHSLCLTIFCILFMHIQVANRFLLSSNPWPYWAIFHLENRQKNRFLSSKLQITKYHLKISYRQLWFFSYFILGTVMFANFLPFT